ncbi:Hypothetical membrane protein [Propionibacterium freudenreichii]|nr:Hypothetical membrane protein [Propionibacterium freudenreichii]
MSHSTGSPAMTAGRPGAAPRRRTGGAARAALMGFLALLMVALGLTAAPQRALAQTSDSFDSWTADYTVGTDGTTHVRETLVYRFASDSARHGMYRTLLTREPDGDNKNQDIVYDVSNVQVSSPDAPASFTQSDEATKGNPRERFVTIKIGDANKRVSSATATYVISYDVKGALRDAQGVEQLYWDAVGDNTPDVNDIRITVAVPGGAQQVQCFSGAVGSNTACTSSSVTDQQAVFQQDVKRGSEVMTIGVGIASGLVTNGTPRLEPAAKSSAAQAAPWGIATLAAAAIVGAIYLVRFRKNSADERFLGVPPGTVPVDVDAAQVGPASKHDVVPVRFDPPQIPVALGGLLVDGQVDSQEMTATLVDLAVRRAIQLRSTTGRHGSSELFGRLIDADKATTPYEKKLLDALFGSVAVGTEVNLSDPGSMSDASSELAREVAATATNQGLMKRIGQVGTNRSGAVIGSFVVLIGAWFGGSLLSNTAALASNAAGLTALMMIGALVVVGIITLLIRSSIARRGTRTAMGRAYTDQVQGFEEYLKTAEADQLKFEEGQDIFSQYLPWAIAFGIADRWASLCEQLVAQGRLTETAPYWYYGDPFGFRYAYFTSGVLSGVDSGISVPEPSGGAGFGSGGSAFGGGGFSGGGGGGGGAGGW